MAAATWTASAFCRLAPYFNVWLPARRSGGGPHAPVPHRRFPDAFAQYAAPAGPLLGTQQQRLPHLDLAAVGDVVTEPIAGRGQDQNG